MARHATLSPFRPKAWLFVMAWGFLIVFAGSFVFRNALRYLSLDEEVYGRFWTMKWYLLGHVSGGLIALCLGPFQFWTGFRNRYTKIHRVLGFAYLIGVLIGTVSSVSLALTTGMALHWTWAIALIGLAVAWISTTGMAYRFILKKRIQRHQEWMIRSYVVTFAFVLFRWLSSSPCFPKWKTSLKRGLPCYGFHGSFRFLLQKSCFSGIKNNELGHPNSHPLLPISFSSY